MRPVGPDAPAPSSATASAVPSASAAIPRAAHRAVMAGDSRASDSDCQPAEPIERRACADGTRVPAPPSDGGAGRETRLYRFWQRSTRLRPPHAYEYVAQPTFEEMNSRTFWLFVITSGDWLRVMSMSSVP